MERCSGHCVDRFSHYLDIEYQFLIQEDSFTNLLQEAKQALDLMGRWETIDVTDALELLSPVFESEEVSIYL